MLSKNKIKHIKALQIKKYRQQSKEFLVEGEKIVLELLQSNYQINQLYCTNFFYEKYAQLFQSNSINFELVKEDELNQAGTLVNNSTCLAIAQMPENELLNIEKTGYTLVLDNIQDPGNLGTILRIADWYAITQIVCSENTVDVYNPKVISASMGSFLRIQLFYTDLKDFLYANQNQNIYGAVLAGENLHKISFAANGLIVLGNESQGISQEIMPFIAKKITIPRFGQAESLNVGIATAVICDNLRRNK